MSKLNTNDSIELQTGDVISNCQSKLRDFSMLDASYRNYDLIQVREDAYLIMRDVQLANRMVARMKPEIVQSIINRVENINSALAGIPAGLELSSNSVPWLTLESLFRATLGPHVRTARVTKILHKKRPHLIPILDSVVVQYCETVKRRIDGDEASKMVGWIRTIKTDIERNLDTFRKLIVATNLRISVVRVHDILVWAYSGEYINKFGIPPLWQR